MSGIWTVTSGVVPIHTFTAPEVGWLVTSHIIELRTQLFVVDAQYMLSYSGEVARHAAGLGKPVTRLYITHYHPDHLLGAPAIEAPMVSLESVATKIRAAGDRVAREEHDKVGSDIPVRARHPDRSVAEGEEVVDGIRIEHHHLRLAETEDALVVALPEAKAVIVQDLVYNRAHPFLGERQFEGWREALREYLVLPYDIVLPGHGLPGGKAVYLEMIDYLDFAEDALGRSESATEFKRRLLDRYPPHGCGKVLDHQLRFLFPGSRTGHAQQ